MMKRFTLMVLVAALSPTLSLATVLDSDDFQSYTVGALLPAGATDTHGTYSRPTTVGGVTVQDDPAGTAGNKVLKIYRESATIYLTGNFKTTTTLNALSTSNEKLVYTFDVYTASTNLNSNLCYLDATTAGERLGGYYIMAPSAGKSRIRYLTFNSSTRAESGVDSSVYLDVNKWYTGTYELYQLEGDWVYNLAFSDGVNIFTVATGIKFYPEIDNLTGNIIRLGFSPQGNSVTTYLDNFLVQTSSIPEPVTAVGLISVITILLRRRSAF